MPARPDIVAYPKTAAAFQIRALDVAIATHEAALGIERGTIEILPVCETALGVVHLREIAGASARVRCALLGAEDLAADLCAERSRGGDELDYARRREHVAAVRQVLAPTAQELDQARKIVAAFEAAREQGDDRALVDGLWVEVPTYLNALRLLAGNR